MAGSPAASERTLAFDECAEGVAQRRVARSQRRGGDFAAPRKRRAGRVGGRADERAAADVAAQQPARLELAVRADDGRAADLKAVGELTLRRHARSRRQVAARNRRFQKTDQVSVEGSSSPDKLPFDLLNHEASNPKVAVGSIVRPWGSKGSQSPLGLWTAKTASEFTEYSSVELGDWTGTNG